MSHRYEEEEEEEDELQRILEGRDVEEFDDNGRQSDDGYDHNSVDNNDYSREQLMTKKKEKKSSEDKFEQKVNNRVKVSNKRQIIEDLTEENQNQQNDDINDDKNNEKKTEIKPKVRRTVKRATLTADILMTKTGIVQLKEMFKSVKFGGKGHELSDLNKIMFKLEHWSHRVFPKLTFDDFLERVEQIGTKRPLKTFVSKIRYDLPLNLDPDEEVVVNHSDDESPVVMDSNAMFDAIVGQQNANIEQEIEAYDQMFNIEINEDFNIETNESIGNKQINEDMVNISTNNSANDSRIEDIGIEMLENKSNCNEMMSEDEIIRQINSNDIE